MITQKNKSINESQNTINESKEDDILEANQNEIKGKNYDLREKVRKFIEKIEKKEDVVFEDFFLFKKI
jgi:predicted nuclease with TOPRIM domain